jgi:hypothetical protein
MADQQIAANHPARAKIHLIIKGYSICNSRIREGGRLAVTSRREFEALPTEGRCLKCEAVVSRIAQGRAALSAASPPTDTGEG